MGKRLKKAPGNRRPPNDRDESDPRSKLCLYPNDIAEINFSAAEWEKLTGDKSIRCWVYPTGGKRSEPIVILPKGNADTRPMEALRLADLDLRAVFPCGYYSQRLHNAPGTSVKLDNTYEILTSRIDELGCANHSVTARFQRKWEGNIVVVKLSKRHGENGCLIQIPTVDRSFMDMLVGLFLAEWFAVEDLLASYSTGSRVLDPGGELTEADLAEIDSLFNAPLPQPLPADALMWM